MRKPDPPQPPPQYTPSFAEAGLIAQEDRLIEIRAPNPDEDLRSRTHWDRIYLTPMAARQVRKWLDTGINVALGDEDPPS